MNFKLLAKAMTGLVLLTGTAAVSAHAISIGFTPGANNGEINLWMGTYTHGGYVATEGSANLIGVNGTVFGPTNNPFTTGSLVRPTGLTDGSNNFYVSGPLNGAGALVNSDADFLSTCPACGPATNWQGVTIGGLAAGDYQFTYIPIANPSLNWTPWNDSLSSTFTITAGQIGGGVPEPSTLALMGLGLVGFGVARRRRKQA